jgi:hypothetical protein
MSNINFMLWRVVTAACVSLRNAVFAEEQFGDSRFGDRNISVDDSAPSVSCSLLHNYALNLLMSLL